MEPTVKDVMTTRVFSVTRDASFQAMATGLREHRVSAFPVVDDAGQVIGVVSEADMLTKEALGSDAARDAGDDHRPTAAQGAREGPRDHSRRADDQPAGHRIPGRHPRARGPAHVLPQGQAAARAGRGPSPGRHHRPVGPAVRLQPPRRRHPPGNPGPCAQAGAPHRPDGLHRRGQGRDRDHDRASPRPTNSATRSCSGSGTSRGWSRYATASTTRLPPSRPPAGSTC